ncbi:MAG TPA: type II toxin-antitoxin system VapC family toxin [Longimicrobiales bacterium]|nr:type II toxin-antitoxin system VapC family toxin [Longimicrobiales bacterium]
MVIDTSAVLVLLLAEPESDRVLEAILASERRLVGAPTLVEAAAVMRAKRGPSGVIALDALLQELDIEVVAMSKEAARLASDAYCRYGKGVGSPGVLNYGDCLAYGVARDLQEPLLFKGDDFGRTDVDAVAY